MRSLRLISMRLLIGLSGSALATFSFSQPILGIENPASIPQLLHQPQPELQQAVITLERTACFGFCPIYKLIVYGNGQVVYEGKQFVKVTGTRTTTISQAAVRNLLLEFECINYFDLKDQYAGGPTDAPFAITSLTFGKRQKSVNHYLASPVAPKQLIELENKIDRIVNSQQWIGTERERTPNPPTRP